jgi:uncharacterized protein DUF2752
MIAPPARLAPTAARSTWLCPKRSAGALGVELAAAALCAAALGAVALGALSGGREVGDGLLLCPFRAVTGLPCPFCGMTHSLIALGAGDLGGSLHRHPLGPAVALLAVAGLWRIGRALAARTRVTLPRGALIAGLGALAAAWVVQLAGALA